MGDITTAQVKQYGANVQMLSQQKGSVLASCVRLESGVVGEQAYFDQLAATAAVRKTTRNSDTPLVKSDHRRRRVTMYDYEWADLLDKEDKLKMITDPTNEYAVNAAWALGRAKDDAIIAAASGTAYTGKEGGTSQALGVGQQIAVGGEGISLAKLLSAKKKLDNADVDPSEERFCAITGTQVAELLNITEIKSMDYNTQAALAKGEAGSFLGFTFKLCNRLATSGGDRLVLAWARTGLLIAIGADIKAEITKRADKSYATQVYAAESIGSTRMEEAKVVEITCNE